MPELSNGMWKFKGRGLHRPSTVYLRDDEIIGAIVDNPNTTDPQLVLLTLHSGAVNINWVEHHREIIDYIEEASNARETVEES